MIGRILFAALILCLASPACADPWQRACAAFYQRAGVSAPAQGEPIQLEALAEHFNRGDALGYTGVALVDVGGMFRLVRAQGFADDAGRTPVSVTTVFDVGSVSKQFTAAAVMLLAEQGRLHTSDPIVAFLPNTPRDKREITIHQLLTHTSGLPAGVAAAQDAWTRDLAIERALAAPLIAEPGMRFVYSNTGYMLLAAIIEAASGASYEAVLTELFRRAGLRETGWAIAQRPGFQAARGTNLAGRVATPDPTIWADDGPNWGRRGSGSLLSTSADLRRWARALMRGDVLSNASLEQMIWPHVREPGEAPSFYGYGWTLSAGPDGTCRIWHDGSNSRHINVLSIFPERDLITHISSFEARSPVSGAVLRSFHPILFQTAQTPLPARRALAGEQALRLAGDWTGANGDTIHFIERGGRVYLQATAPQVARLFSGLNPLPTEDAARVARARPQLPVILDGIATGSFDPLLTVLRADIQQEDEVQYWKEQVNRWSLAHGAFRESEIIATVRLGDRVLSYVLLHFVGRSIPLTVEYDASGDIFIGTSVESRPEIDFVPFEFAVTSDADGRFWVDNAAYGGSVRLTLSEDGAAMRILCARGEEFLHRASGLDDL